MIYHLRDKIPELKENWHRYEDMWNRIEIPSKTVLLKEGEISFKMFCIEKGALRVWFNNKDRDVTFQFFFENEGVSSIESFTKGVPSAFSIESIEPSVIRWIYKKDLETIIRENPSVRQYVFNFLIERQINYANHFISFIKYNPSERYKALLKDKPHIINRVPQHYIASYLGITPVSLSRIRKKII